MGKTSVKVKEKYNAKAYDRITLRVKHGDKDIVQSAADASGQSLNAYIIQAISERMERDEIGKIFDKREDLKRDCLQCLQNQLAKS